MTRAKIQHQHRPILEVILCLEIACTRTATSLFSDKYLSLVMRLSVFDKVAL